ncbi:tRNA uridine-5-carboxymethylaminomethyl(34) synthesis GTPase MnmE [soil metagenome]
MIRLSGPRVRFGLETLVGSLPEPRRASLRSIGDAGHGLIDRGLVTYFPAPASFTGEDVGELQLHGGRAVVAAVLEALGALPGFRPAEAGEFTRRAFAGGRLDLTQVEGLADLIAAETEAQRRQALRQADGQLGRLYDGWREQLIRARALIEAELDFSEEEDVPGSVSDQAWAIVRAVRQELVNHVSDVRGERVRDGAEIVVLGPPNSGKSSLINAIAQRDVAIVSPEPGTTRDLIEVRLDLRGFPATLVDTAGLRESAGLVEREGIRRAEERGRGADIVVWLEDVCLERSQERPPLGPKVVRVGSKIDLTDSATERSRLAGLFDHLVSATTGEGVEELVVALGSSLAAGLDAGESPLATRSRHRSALAGCVAALDVAVTDDGRPIELRAEDLRRAGDALARITGRIGVEDLLDVIFREFCVGK